MPKEIKDRDTSLLMRMTIMSVSFIKAVKSVDFVEDTRCIYKAI